MISTSNGESWNVISPLFKQDIVQKKIRVDTFEFFPDVIINNLSNPDEARSIFDF